MSGAPAAGPPAAGPPAAGAPAGRRRTFGPVTLLGLAAAGLSAVAGDRLWVVPETSEGPGAAAAEAVSSVRLGLDETAQMPLATALALVVLAAWGALLVTRGRVRRVLAGLALVAALGIAASVVVGAVSIPGDVRADLAASLPSAAAGPATAYTGWFWAAGAGAALSVLATAAAVRWVPQWPQMGSRYDAPSAPTDEPASDLELWRAFDEGRDPTA